MASKDDSFIVAMVAINRKDIDYNPGWGALLREKNLSHSNLILLLHFFNQSCILNSDTIVLDTVAY